MNKMNNIASIKNIDISKLFKYQNNKNKANKRHVILSRNKKDIGAYCWRKGEVNIISKKDFINMTIDFRPILKFIMEKLDPHCNLLESQTEDKIETLSKI